MFPYWWYIIYICGITKNKNMENLDRYVFETESERSEWLKRQCYKTTHSNISNVTISEDELGYYVDCLKIVKSNAYYYSDNFGNRGNFGKFGY